MVLLLSVSWAYAGHVEAATALDDSPQGEQLFRREWLPAGARDHGADGLGPVYNETSCLTCHNQGGSGGAGPSSVNVQILSLAHSAAGGGAARPLHPKASFSGRARQAAQAWC